jgi:hypothetical protein
MARSKFRAGVLALGLSAAVGAVLAAPARAAEPDLSLTVYNNDLALVQDQRTLDVGKGRQRLEFKDVSAAIRPETVTLAAPGLQVVEQNFDYDLLTPAKMMEKAVGQQIQLVRINPSDGKETRETATVLSANEGVVLRIGDHIEVLRDDGVPTRVIFDKIPDNLRARPTLSVTVDSDHAGPRPATLSYLTKGLSWKADYVTLFDEPKGALDLQGWVTLTNTSGSAFTEARTELVAGSVQTEGGDEGDEDGGRLRPARRTFGGQAGQEASTQAQVADFYVYPLAHRTTIAENQTKQVSFLEAKGVKAQKAYHYSADDFDSAEQPAHVESVLAFTNSGAGGLGAPLPAGVVRVYVRDASGEPKFIGENRIAHTPQGSELVIKTGEAFDITVQSTLVKQERVGPYRSKNTMSYLVRNARAEPATVELRQGGLLRNGKVLSESLKSTRIDASTLGWDVPVPAGGETTLTFTVDTGW